ncbi:MAG: AraC family transcriptional regulator [Planctomycetota bacterium]|nr:AraC family transcriptional regulator [Planctomycetota bacterium]
MSALFYEMLSSSLRFEYQAGGIAPLRDGHTTGWRTLPGLMLSQAHTGAERICLEDGREIIARDGGMIVLPAGVRHKVDVISRTEVRQWVHVNYFLLESLDIFSLFEVPLLFDAGAGRRAGAMIRAWVKSEDQRAGSTPLERAAELNAFGFRLLRLLAPYCRPAATMIERLEGLGRIRAVIEHMKRNFGRPIYRDELARMAFLSPTQFHQVFRKATGFSPMKFLERIRLRYAQQLLIATDRKLADIAMECGYSDPYVFSKSFKKVCGHSPSEYRLITADLRSAPRM